MSGAELRVRIARLGLSQAEFGRLIGKSADQMTRYVTGATPMPLLLVQFMELLESADSPSAAIGKLWRNVR